MIPPSALLNRTFRRIWLASLVSGTAVAAHDTAATWTMNLYCLVPMALAGAGWTLAASELWVIAQRSIPKYLRGRISALMMVLSQGAMTLGGVVWGLSAELTGTRITLLAAAFLFLTTVLGSMLFSGIFRKSLTVEAKAALTFRPPLKSKANQLPLAPSPN